jgi:hypothetical protein
MWGGGNIDTFDFDEALKPTYLGDLREIDQIVKKRYECVICCQVLEHLEYKYFRDIIEKLSIICSKVLILSLPCRMIEFSAYFAIPHFGDKEVHIIIPRFWEKKLKWVGQHYWEIGIKGKSKKDILAVISDYFVVRKQYNASGHMYHWYIIADVTGRK